jgi:phosphoglycerate kinase
MERANGFKYLSDVDVKGKTVLMRVDLNSNVIDHKVVLNDRILKHTKAIGEIARQGAKVVAISHQGRHGRDDYISLKQHSELMGRVLGSEVLFHPIDEGVGGKIRSLEDGNILLLENTRFLFKEKMKLAPEDHARHEWVRLIAKNCDLFAQDALSIAHRSHASVVGFSPLLPCFVGPTLEKELQEIEGQLTAKESPKIFILSGFKLEEPIKIMKTMLESGRTDFVLCGGMLGKTLLKAKGISLGAEDEFMKEKGFDDFIPELKPLLEKYGDKIVLPVDLAVDNNGRREELRLESFPSEFTSFDIGEKTIALFSAHIQGAKCATLNGPLGVAERTEFARGTKEVYRALAHASAHTILGGGQTLEAIKLLNIDREQFNLVSLAGGALLEYLAGKELPGLDCLKQH